MNTPRQPNFNVAKDTAAIPGTDFDNMSDEELEQLIAASHKLKTGKPLNLPKTPPPTPKRVVDLDQYFRSPA